LSFRSPWTQKLKQQLQATRKAEKEGPGKSSRDTKEYAGKLLKRQEAAASAAKDKPKKAEHVATPIQTSEEFIASLNAPAKF
jgi:hypothetical protein